MIRNDISIEGQGPGTRHTLTAYHFGPATGPRTYIQGGLHADEAPGMAVAWALIDRLTPLESRLRGPVTVVPAANPIGLAQPLLGGVLGRFDLADGGNFNRGFADLAPECAHRIKDLLGDDPAANTTLIRAALRAAHAAQAPQTPAARLKHALLGLALDADLVLDLHCDGEALTHLYTLPALTAPLSPLTALLGARALLTASDSGLNPFDEALSRPWADLAARFPDHPIPLACTACTVELRGLADVIDALAATDAQAILGHLAHIGVLDMPPPALPPLACAPTPLAGSEPLLAPVAGILFYNKALGTMLAPGDRVACVLDPATGTRHPVRATTSGLLYARTATRVVGAGQRLGKIAGTDPRRSGPLLSP